MKQFILSFALLTFTQFLIGQQADDILGVWLSSSGEAKIKIEKVNNTYTGKIVWLKEPLDANGNPKTDIENEDPKKQNTPILGYQILNGFSYDADDQEWVDGTIYDPKSGNTYSSIMSLKNNKLDIRGYIGISVFGRTETWSRSSLN